MLRKKNKTFLQKVIIALNRVIQLVSFMSFYIINENMRVHVSLCELDQDWRYFWNSSDNLQCVKVLVMNECLFTSFSLFFEKKYKKA